MSRLKFAAIELLLTGIYAVMILAAVKLCLMAAEAGLLEGRRAGSLVLLVLSLPPWLAGYFYRMIVGLVPSYPVTWRMGLLFTLANGLLSEVSGLRQGIYAGLQGYYPIQQWGVILLICMASLIVAAGLFRVGTHIWALPAFAKRGKQK